MLDVSTPLSANFTLGELLRSETAERDPKLKAEQMNPDDSVVENLRYLCTSSLQPIRAALGYPITISSGYRCPKLNALVKGATSSQHLFGQAADCSLDTGFLAADATAALRREIQAAVAEVTGSFLRPNVNANFYLFAFVCLHLETLDIDQVIHEYGEQFGRPAWVHIAASKNKNNRQILAIGKHVPSERKVLTLKAALLKGC